jgi:hypothetical protein
MTAGNFRANQVQLSLSIIRKGLVELSILGIRTLTAVAHWLSWKMFNVSF